MLINNKYKALAFLIVPFLLAVVDFFFLKAAFPLHSGSPGYDQDPAYAYLFNGLLILEGYPPYHIDHPGTPLQLLFALTIFIRWGLTRVFGDSGLDIVDSVINNPESYLHDMAVLLLALNLAALVFFGRRIAEATGKIYLGMFCQLSLLSFTIMAPKATYPAPEALLIFCSLVLLGYLSPRIFSKSTSVAINSTVSSKIVGAVFALGLAVKITFVPMVLLVILLPKGRERLIGVTASILIFLLLTWPALPNIDRFLVWVTGLVSNSGIHGGGGGGLIDLKKIPGAVYNLFHWFPLFIVTIFLAILAATIGILRKSLSLTHGPQLLLLIAIIQTALVLKHPGAHYMVSVLPITALLLTWLFLLIPRTSSTIKTLFVSLTGALVLHSILITVLGIHKITDQRKEMTDVMVKINEELSRYPDALIICSFRCAIPQYALSMAFIYAPQLISAKTSKKLLNFFDFDIFQDKLISIGEPSRPLSTLMDFPLNNMNVFLVTPKIYAPLESLTVRPIITSRSQSLYRILHIFPKAPL